MKQGNCQNLGEGKPEMFWVYFIHHSLAFLLLGIAILQL